MSTFHGLEMAKQALFAQQSALYTTGHNIANANTEGYSRQRVNFETTNPFPSVSRNRPEIPGQIGTGVKTGSVQRIRNQYLDYQFREENNKAGYYETVSSALGRLENLMNEPSENGLSATMDQFWQSIQDLSTNPKESGVRSLVAQRGVALAETFNYFSDSISSMRSDLKNQIDVTVSDANSLIRQVDALNKQIKNIETVGYLPNDLYDERDRLIDELSSMVSIQVDYTKSSDSALDIADGLATIKLVNKEGAPLGVNLVDGQTGTYQELSVSYAKDTNSAEDLNGVTGVKVGGTDIDISKVSGSLKGFIDSYGFDSDVTSTTNPVAGSFTEMLANLNDMAREFAEEFNRVHESGVDLNDNEGIAFFVPSNGAAITAENISVNSAIVDDPDLIAASEDFDPVDGQGSGELGNGVNAAALANVFDTPLNDLGENTTVKSFYESLIGELGVNAQEANRMTETTSILRSQVENQRMSVSSVSLDEEMANMIKFQHAYNAAARSLTAVDELLDRVINNMGIVGR